MRSRRACDPAQDIELWLAQWRVFAGPKAIRGRLTASYSEEPIHAVGPKGNYICPLCSDHAARRKPPSSAPLLVTRMWPCGVLFTSRQSQQCVKLMILNPCASDSLVHKNFSK